MHWTSQVDGPSQVLVIQAHTPSIAFRYLNSSKLCQIWLRHWKGHSLSPRSCPPTRSAPSERFGYYYDCGSSLAPKHPREHETHSFRVKKEKFRLDWNDSGFICAGVSDVVSYKRNVWYNLSCLLQTYCRLSIMEKLFVSETYGVISYGSAWRKDVLNQCLEFDPSLQGPYTTQPCTMLRYFMQSHIHRVHACFAVTCTLHFRKNDRDLLRATAVTRGSNQHRNESAQKVDPGGKMINLPPFA